MNNNAALNSHTDNTNECRSGTTHMCMVPMIGTLVSVAGPWHPENI